MGEVLSLSKPKRLKQEQADAIRQLIFQFDLSDDAQAEISNAVYRLTEEPQEQWPFMRISPEQFRHVSQAIRHCRKALTTMSIWNAAITYLRFDTGEILATRDQLAQDTNIAPQNVSTAMTDLERIGAILRKKRGKRVVYFVNPNVGWNGGEGSRVAAAKEAPKLRVVADNERP